MSVKLLKYHIGSWAEIKKSWAIHSSRNLTEQLWPMLTSTHPPIHPHTHSNTYRHKQCFYLRQYAHLCLPITSAWLLKLHFHLNVSCPHVSWHNRTLLVDKWEIGGSFSEVHASGSNPKASCSVCNLNSYIKCLGLKMWSRIIIYSNKAHETKFMLLCLLLNS